MLLWIVFSTTTGYRASYSAKRASAWVYSISNPTDLFCPCLNCRGGIAHNVTTSNPNDDNHNMARKPTKGIIVKFRQHLLAEYWQAHHKLDTQYALVVDIHDLFNNDKRIFVPALVTSKLVESIDLPNKEDIARAMQMFNSAAMALRWHLHKQETYALLRNSNIALSNAIEVDNFLSCSWHKWPALQRKLSEQTPLLKSAQSPFPSGPANKD